MNADPLEVMLMNMGYRIPGGSEVESDSDTRQANFVRCRTS